MRLTGNSFVAKNGLIKKPEQNACNGAGGRVGFEVNAYRAGPLMRSVPRLKFMRPELALLTLAIVTGHASAQLISPSGDLPLNRISVEIASDVPAKLQGDVSLTFRDLDIYFDGGSHGAEFDRRDSGKLMLFFPHAGCWTPAARKKRVQPVAVLTRRNGKQILVEIKPGSKLNQRMVDLMDADISSGRHSPDKLAILERVRDSVRKRSLLKEIADRMDSKTGELKLDDDPFGDVDPFD